MKSIFTLSLYFILFTALIQNLCNSDTIEIRIFRSTLNIETFEAILRFVARLAFVAKNIRAVELASMSFEELMGDDEHVLAYWKRISGGVE